LTTTVRRYGAGREWDLGTVTTLGGHRVTATEVPHRGAAPDVRFALAGIPRSDWTLGYHVRDGTRRDPADCGFRWWWRR